MLEKHINKKFNKKINHLRFLYHTSTRAPRSNEIDGVDYYFVSEDKFKELIKNNEFYEHAKSLEITTVHLRKL